MTTNWTPIADNTTSWSDVPKPLPTTSVVTQVLVGGGDSMGLLLALTYAGTSTTSSVVTNIWTPINNNSTSWTEVPKAS